MCLVSLDSLAVPMSIAKLKVNLFKGRKSKCCPMRWRLFTALLCSGEFHLETYPLLPSSHCFPFPILTLSCHLTYYSMAGQYFGISTWFGPCRKPSSSISAIFSNHLPSCQKDPWYILQIHSKFYPFIQVYYTYILSFCLFIRL